MTYLKCVGNTKPRQSLIKGSVPFWLHHFYTRINIIDYVLQFAFICWFSFYNIPFQHQESEMKTSPIRQKYRCNAKSSKFMRKEVWIYPDGMRCLHRTDCIDCNGSNYKLTLSEEKRLKEMDPEEVKTRIFILIFHQLH